MTEKELGRKVEKEREKFFVSYHEPSHSSIFVIPLQVSFHYMVLMDYVLLILRSETSPRTLKNTQWFSQKVQITLRTSD
jgi:hypothetical protein